MASVEANGASFYCRTEGSSGEPLLLVHGTGADADAFAGVIGSLARSFRVVAYDRRGFTRTKAAAHPPHDYYSRHADDAAALLKALGLGRTTVVGWSAGGLVALALALHHPETIARIVLYEPPFLVKSRPPASFAATFAALSILRAIGLKRPATKLFLRAVLARRDGTNDFDALPPPVREAQLANAPGALAELDGGTGEEFDQAKLRRIACPIALLLGDQSAPLFEQAANRLTQVVNPARRKVVAGAGHVMNVLQPTAFADSVVELTRA